MSTLIISDTHLCEPFDEKQYELLTRLFSKHDRIILNGDFWEGYWYTFEGFLHSKWARLFPILKSRETIYIYGNHDRESYSDSRRERFCSHATWRYELPIKDKTYIFEHGNRLALKFDEKHHMQRISRWLFTPYYLFEMAIVHVIGLRFFHWIFGKLNAQIKHRLAGELKPHEIFVCGHTHVSERDLHGQYINTGVNKYSFAEYAIIDDAGEIHLHDERY